MTSSITSGCETWTDCALDAVKTHLTNPEFIKLRARLGDCAAGAIAAGASEQDAVRVAVKSHTDPELRSRIFSVGGLLVGAEQQLQRDVDG